MKTLTKTLIATAMVAATGAAQAEISGNVAIASDYKFRGVSQTDNGMALQGGLDYGHDSGFYVGTWMSNVDSNFFNNGTDPQLEMDFYVGYAGEAGDFGYDVSLVQFEYSGCDACDTTELYVNGSYSMFNATFAYTNEIGYLGDTNSEGAWYLNVGAETEVTEGWTVHGAVGYNAGDFFDSLPGNTPDSYFDYSIGVATSMAGVDLDLSWVDVDSDGEDIFGNSDTLTDGRLLFTVSKSL